MFNYNLTIDSFIISSIMESYVTEKVTDFRRKNESYSSQ